MLDEVGVRGLSRTAFLTHCNSCLSESNLTLSAYLSTWSGRVFTRLEVASCYRPPKLGLLIVIYLIVPVYVSARLHLLLETSVHYSVSVGKD